MDALTIVVYLSGYLFLVFLSISIGETALFGREKRLFAATQFCLNAACGLYFIAELCEEYTSLTKKVLKYTNYVRIVSFKMLRLNRGLVRCWSLCLLNFIRSFAIFLHALLSGSLRHLPCPTEEFSFHGLYISTLPRWCRYELPNQIDLNGSVWERI